MASQKRISKELGEVTKTPLPGISVSLLSESNVHKWNVTLNGPEGSPYAGGKFKLLVDLPIDYPFKPPIVNFKTRIWHPNVTYDDNGSICIGILKNEMWKPSSKISSVLQAIQNLLLEPNPDDPLEVSIANKYKDDREGYNQEAKEQTRKYAIN